MAEVQFQVAIATCYVSVKSPPFPCKLQQPCPGLPPVQHNPRHSFIKTLPTFTHVLSCPLCFKQYRIWLYTHFHIETRSSISSPYSMCIQVSVNNEIQ